MKEFNYIYLLVFATILLSCNQKNNFEINKIVEGKYEFPILKGNPTIVNKINYDLIKDLLDLDIKKEYESIFENIVATKDSSIPILTFLNYKVNYLNKKLYTLTFNSEGCGAYCEKFERSYNYDLKTGNRIYLDSIFTLNGKRSFLEKLNFKRIKILKKKIEELEKGKKKIFDQNDYELRIKLLQECKKRNTIVTFEFLDFKIEENVFTIYSDRCSNHAMRALDDVGEFEYSFSFDKIYELLNTYGKKIITTKD